MRVTARPVLSDILSDPFGERSASIRHTPMHILGGRFQFSSNDVGLLDLVDAAYAGLPRHVLSNKAPLFRVQLLTAANERAPKSSARIGTADSLTPPLRLLHGAGLLVGTNESSLVVVSPRERAAMIAVTPALLHLPYYTRYELIEFAVATLAARAQRLVPLHAACVGLGDRGVLLLGNSGAGKTTAALNCLLSGFDFLSEDAVFVTPRSLRATGVANFLHVRTDAMGSMGKGEARLARNSPVIRRRSGIEKFEIDLRRPEFSLATKPLKIVATVFLSARHASQRRRLRRLSLVDLERRLTQAQSYAASLPEWSGFLRRISVAPAFELRRGERPTDTVQVLRTLLGQS